MPSPWSRRLFGRPLLGLALVVLLAACTSGGAGSSAAPTTALPTPTPIAEPTSAADHAAALVLASNPMFSGIPPFDANLIGQASWYRVERAGDSTTVTVRIGWGDCQAGCISEHIWTYSVGADGTLKLVSESGAAVPPDAIPSPAASAGGSGSGVTVTGTVTAGPTCPVVKSPPDPACADRPVPGAVIVVTDASGGELFRAASSPTGALSFELPPGSYRLVPQPVSGLMGTAKPLELIVPATGSPPPLQIVYDTGIR